MFSIAGILYIYIKSAKRCFEIFFVKKKNLFLYKKKQTKKQLFSFKYFLELQPKTAKNCVYRAAVQEEFVAEMLLRLYLFCQSILHRTGRNAAIPTGAACHRGCCPVSSGAQCLYNPFSWDLKPKFPLFFFLFFFELWFLAVLAWGLLAARGRCPRLCVAIAPSTAPCCCTPSALCTVFPTFPIPGTFGFPFS